MIRAVVAGLALGLCLACGGAVQNAKQAARERVEQEIAEEIVQVAAELDELEVEDGRITVGKDGDRMVVESTATLPSDFPIALPADVVVNTVASFEHDGKTTVNVLGTGRARDASADIDAALTSAGFTSSVRHVVESSAAYQASNGAQELTVAVQAAGGDEATWLITWVR